jgi:hypothetical protein
VASGMGLGWRITKIGDETIFDHSGSDPEVRTFAYFLPERQTGALIFTDGDNGAKVIKKIVRMLYPDPVYNESVRAI